MTEKEPELEVLDNFLRNKDNKKFYSADAGKASKPFGSQDDVFQDLKSVKVDSIKGVIEDIEELIDRREELSTGIYKKVDKMLNVLNNVELQLNSGASDDASLKRDILNVKQKQIELEEIRIQEEVNNWRDIAQLKKELRERVKEFKEKESRLDMLDKILAE